MNQSPRDNKFLSALILFAAAAVTTLSSGCQTFNSQGKPLPTEQAALAADRGSYSVETYAYVGQPKQFKGKLTGTTTVSEAIAESGSVKKYANLDVEVLRIVEHKGRNRGLRMPVQFNPKTGTLSPEQDYALLDGDRIVVKPKQNSGLTKVIGTVLGGKR